MSKNTLKSTSADESARFFEPGGVDEMEVVRAVLDPLSNPYVNFHGKVALIVTRTVGVFAVLMHIEEQAIAEGRKAKGKSYRKASHINQIRELLYVEGSAGFGLLLFWNSLDSEALRSGAIRSFETERRLSGESIKVAEYIRSVTAWFAKKP